MEGDYSHLVWIARPGPEKSGFGILVGLGYEFRLTRGFALGVGAGYNKLFIDDRNFESAFGPYEINLD
ncbi:MAG TPA: hypothetical protein DIT99_23980 [Candidatus Latescibacteria bacterium]|nr:hypothetical protein [Candidatus Latescibacterota bacterium]